jgi:hypothetical protein
MSTKAENYLSESAYAAKPMLRWIATNYPKTKITVHDYLPDMMDQQIDESWLFKTHHYLQPSHQIKHNVTTSIDHRRLVDKGLRIAMVMGVDKPKLCIKDGKWFLYFVDSLAQRNNTTVDDVNNVTTELFYWSPDACDIMAKQAHLIRQWFDLPMNLGLQHVVSWPNSDYSLRTLFEQLIKPVIYPDYDFRTFQVAKSNNIFRAEMDSWFFKNMQGTTVYNAWQAGVDYMINNTHDRYLEHHKQGLVQYLSPLYYVGESSTQNNNKIDTGSISALQTAKDQRRGNRTYAHCINHKLIWM